MKNTNENDEKIAFGERLNLAMESRGIAARKRNALLKKWTGVGTEGCRKWLRGLSIPEKANIKVICLKLYCREEWLEYGVGAMYRDAEMLLLDKEDEDIRSLTNQILSQGDKVDRHKLKILLEMFLPKDE